MKRWFPIVAMTMLLGAPEALAQASGSGVKAPFIGVWRVVTVGLTDASSGSYKMISPDQQRYTFNIDKTGSIRKASISTMFVWSYEGGLLRVAYRDGRIEKYTAVNVATANDITSLGLIGSYDYYGDGRIISVTMGLWKE